MSRETQGVPVRVVACVLSTVHVRCERAGMAGGAGAICTSTDEDELRVISIYLALLWRGTVKIPTNVYLFQGSCISSGNAALCSSRMASIAQLKGLLLTPHPPLTAWPKQGNRPGSDNRCIPDVLIHIGVKHMIKPVCMLR